MNKILCLLIIYIYTILGSGCVTAPLPTPATVGSDLSNNTSGALGSNTSGSEETRPGLATQWGETRTSQVHSATFTRSNPTMPIVNTLYYNSREGIKAMVGLTYQQATPKTFPLVGNFFSPGEIAWGIQNEPGQLLEGLSANNRNYVIGEVGSRYSIVVHNYTDYRVEVVLSVDGLDVMDGKAAAFTKPGYLVAPHSTLTVDGFRQSMETVAAFRFGSVSESYANKKGNTRNVGVIGLALFYELLPDDEINRRHSADPFPNRFATPPE
jgi:hypothetical protein